MERQALRLRLAVQMKGFGGGGGSSFFGGLGGGLAGFGRFARLAGLGIGPAHQRLQQHAGVLEVALPQQPRALTGHAVGRVGGQGIVGGDNPARGRGTTLRAPLGLLNLALAAPFDH